MKGVVSFLFVVLAVTSVSQAGAAPGEACISDAATKNLNACANAQGGRFNVSEYGTRPKVSLHEQVQQDKKLKELKPSNPSLGVGDLRDTRQIRLAQRQLGLLVTAISQTEEVLQITPPTATDRVIILRRLAEDYVELESAAMREKVQAEVDRDNFRRQGNQQGAGRSQATVDARAKTVKLARQAAIQNYETIVREYAGAPSPKFPKNPPAAVPVLDEVMYYLAYEYEQAEDTSNALRVYRDLVTKRPDSKYVLNAYLAFGELFFVQAQSNPDVWPTAKAAYSKVVSQPPPANKVYGYAWYKLAYIGWNTGDFPGAIDAFKKTIEYGANYPQLPNAPKLADSARKDIVPVYAQGNGSADAAYALFHPIAGDTSGSNEKTFQMLDDLGVAYLDTGHYDQAIKVYRDLMQRDSSGEKVCNYQSRISEATMALKSGDKPAIVRELENQRKVYDRYKAEQHSEKSKFQCSNRTAALVTETAMAWHLEAVGIGDKKGTMDGTTLDKAAELYGIAAKTWNGDEFSKFEFPRLIKEDWPSMYRIKYNMADLLYFRAQTTQDEQKALDKWRECGPAFRKVVEENPSAKEAPEAAYASVLCYEQVYLQEHKKIDEKKGKGALPGAGRDIRQDSEEQYKAKEPTEGQKGMLSAFDAFICYVHPDKSDAKGYQKLIEVKYARARIYFEFQKWEEAAAAFKDVAESHPESDKAPFAAELYLESTNVLTWHGPKRTSCIDEMNLELPKFQESFCKGDKATQNAETCATLGKVQCDVQRAKAQKLVDEADKGGAANPVDSYQTAGKAYYDLWERYGLTPMRNKQPMQCERMDEILYNSARAFQAGRLVANAIRARTVLMSAFPQSELAKEALYEIGGNYQAIAVYDQAADYYERYANQYKDRKNADSALSDAIVLRLGLGHEQQAIDDAESYRRYYGARNPATTAQVQYFVGAHYVEKGDNDRARLALTGAMSIIDRAPPDIQLQAHATLARALQRMGSANYKNEYARVVSMWDDRRGPDGQFVVDQIGKAYPNEDKGARERRVGKALDAVGEALFQEAEDARKAKVDALPFPEYRGQRAKADLQRYNETTLFPWVDKKNNAIAEVFKLYEKIPKLKPGAPPRWVIAAASRAGLMWGGFVDEFRRSADNLPKDWDNFPEAKAQYIQTIDEKSEPLKARLAKPALQKCLNESVTYQYFDNYSRECEKWLAKNYKAEYHVVDELRGTPTLANSGLDDRPPPLVIGGGLYHERATGPATEKAGSAEDTKPNKDARAPR